MPRPCLLAVALLGGLLPVLTACAARPPAAQTERGWFPFQPKPDTFQANGGFDLRSLNEKVAGEGGFIAAKGAQFVHSKTGQPVRFWAVNGPPGELRDPAALRHCARLLARYGVNLARIHHGYFDQNGDVRMAAVRQTQEVVEALKLEGIYSHFSIYFPLWLTPKPDNPFLKGYDGNKKPFAALFFNPDFQKQYREWWRALLLTPNEKTGKRLVNDPAVMGLEIQNEDSYLFWTFSAENIPDPQLRILETQFGDWLKTKYGTLDAAFAKWEGQKVARDAPAEGRVGFRPLWNMFNEKTARDRDTARFLVESQRRFYQETYRFLRELGFKGVITCSNWATASPEVFGPLEKYTYTVGDFIDRHGYFSSNHKGEFAEWSIRDGHTYSDRSALRFDAEEPGKPKVFTHPVMDPTYDDKPSMISETTFNRPNRYRTEAMLYYAAYGALQDTDAIVHFALDGADWNVKPNFWMQPWTLMSPAMMGQSPATALLYRQGMVAPGQTLVNLSLKVDDLLDLKGTPLPQDAALDELRLKDVPQGQLALQPGGRVDPLVHYVGRTSVRFTQSDEPSTVADLTRYVDREKQTIASTTGQLKLDYGKGALTVNAPMAQGVSGALAKLGAVALKDMSVASDMDLGQVLAVSLDGKPLATSGRILLQVMSEEQNGGWRTEPASEGVKRILSIGTDPWMVREIRGTVRFTRPDAARLKVTALDLNGYPAEAMGDARSITLRPATLYYLVETAGR